MRTDSERPPWHSHEFIFVAGMHRSGTTLLAKIIATSGRATGLESSGAHMGEGQFLQDVYPIGKAYGGVTAWALDDSSHLTDHHARDTPDAAERLWAAWSPWWDLDREYLVEKTPINLNKMRYLQHLFPRSKFIVITRHPITQALAVMKWHPKRFGRCGIGFTQLVENWVRAHEKFKQDVAHIEKLHIVRYEDLVNNPSVHLRALEGFLGFELLNAEKNFDVRRASTYESYWSSVLSSGPTAPTEERVGRMPRLRARAQRKILRLESHRLRRAFKDRVRVLGYDIDNLEG